MRGPHRFRMYEDLIVTFGEPAEYALHRIHLIEVALSRVIAASLTRRGPQTSRCEAVAGPGAAQMNQRGELMLLSQRCRLDAIAREDANDVPIQIRRSELDSMRRHGARIEGVEPARFPVIPRAIVDDHMIVDTEST